MEAPEKKLYLECGKICNTHGIKGDCKAECWCDTPKAMAKLKHLYLSDGGAMKEYALRSVVPFGQMVLLHLEGIETPEAAMPLKGKVLYARRDEIPVPEGAMLLADMIGLPVTDAVTGRLYGHLADIDFAPASPIYTVKTPDGKEVLLPAVPAFVREVSRERGVLITPIPGFFDDAEEV